MIEPKNLKALSDAVRDKHHCSMAAQVNESCIRIAVNEGVYDWHRHPDSDELFLVLEGALRLEFADRASMLLKPGDFFCVPAGVIHRTVAQGRTVNLCFERVEVTTEFLYPTVSPATEVGSEQPSASSL